MICEEILEVLGMFEYIHREEFPEGNGCQVCGAFAEGVSVPEHLEGCKMKKCITSLVRELNHRRGSKVEVIRQLQKVHNVLLDNNIHDIPEVSELIDDHSWSILASD